MSVYKYKNIKPIYIINKILNFVKKMNDKLKELVELRRNRRLLNEDAFYEEFKRIVELYGLPTNEELNNAIEIVNSLKKHEN